MPWLQFSSPKVKRQRFMDQFLVHGEHLGLMMGGTWDSKTGTVDFFPYAHRKADCPDCKSSIPYLHAVTPKVKANMLAWLRARGVRNARWSK